MPNIDVEDPNNYFTGTLSLNLDFSRALLLLALATAPGPGSKFRSNSIWAIAKYSHVYDPRLRRGGLNQFYVNSGIADLDPHQKGILSDDMGMAIALGLLDQQQGILGLADVFQLVAQGVINLAGGGRHRSMPDFLVLLARPLNGHSIVLLECKGSGSPGKQSDQLATACQKQLANVANVMGIGAAIPKLAIATQLPIGGMVSVHVDDPPIQIKTIMDLHNLLKKNLLALQYSMFQDMRTADEVWRDAGFKTWDAVLAGDGGGGRGLAPWHESTFVTLPKVEGYRQPKAIAADERAFLEKDVTVRVRVEVRPSKIAADAFVTKDWTAAVAALSTSPRSSPESKVSTPRPGVRKNVRDEVIVQTGVEATIELDLSSD